MKVRGMVIYNREILLYGLSKAVKESTIVKHVRKTKLLHGFASSENVTDTMFFCDRKTHTMHFADNAQCIPSQ